MTTTFGNCAGLEIGDHVKVRSDQFGIFTGHVHLLSPERGEVTIRSVEGGDTLFTTVPASQTSILPPF